MSTVLAPTPAAADIDTRLDGYDWAAVSAHLAAHGWAMLDRVLAADECDEVAGMYPEQRRFRSHVIMARHGFGRGA